MAKHGKNINVYLMDGESNGRYEVKLANWNVIAYKIPYNLIGISNDLDYIHTPGIYFLFGAKDGHKFVYVGESEDLLKRLTQHTPDKDGYIWEDAVAFVATDWALDKSKIKYLENRLYNIINDIGSYQLKNGNEPTKSSLARSDSDSMEQVIDNIKLLVPVLGYTLFNKNVMLSASSSSDHNDYVESEQLFYLHRNGLNAVGTLNPDGSFTIFKDSTLSLTTRKSCPKQSLHLRAQLLAENKINDDTLNVNLNFKTPSGAASFVIGGSANGWIEWKTESGIAIKELQTK